MDVFVTAVKYLSAFTIFPEIHVEGISCIHVMYIACMCVEVLFLGQISRSKLGKCICLIIVDHQSHYEHVYFGNEPH